MEFIFRYGQFDSAKETFEVISDFESMLDLFICHLNPSSMRRLAQKLEDAAIDSEMRRYCERILRVRSTGWTQGIFANFAAESMVPKGPEWGGGNWDIKTHIELKDSPKWELAGEVMPYMKTSEGTIPSVVTDHIGVYLGAIKGRGNVIEVRDDSLVKAITGENKSNGLLISGPKVNGVIGGDSQNVLPTGMGALSKSTTGRSSEDEQAKTEEEFKKSSYGGVDGSSSEEEEGAGKVSKIVIRIKPVSSSTVDVDKIKEATKQFKLGDGLGPPIRTKSLSAESQDLSSVLALPAPATTATSMMMNSSEKSVTAGDLFGTDSLAVPPSTQIPPMVVGAGVTAGPIPEDFFQNTISSLQVAASLSPAGTFLGRSDPTLQVNNGSQISSNQSIAAKDVGFPDGGVPPQVLKQPAISLESIGLADGGIPPQTAAQVPSQAVPIAATSKPMDLAALETLVPNSGTDALKTTTPAPVVVRPGQVTSLNLLNFL